MKIKDSILLTLKNLLHPAGLIGLVIAIIIPAIIWFLGRPSGGHKEIIRQLDLNLPLPLFLFQMAVAIILFAFLNKDFREWFKGILPQKPFSILAIAAAIGSFLLETQIWEAALSCLPVSLYCSHCS
ncbi:MAG: hypothetical protein IJ982_00265 [Fibrobacter sp.]|nr:hypothetical protein [Fibrobacter sp.]